MSRLFGTDGVRGIANKELTPQLAYQLGHYGAQVLAGQTSHRPRIIVGHDARLSADMLQAALVAGITSSGADAYMVNTIPTPGIAYLTKSQSFDAGVMISASHNSFEFNGIKFFNKDGFKLADDVEDQIEACIRGEINSDVQTKVGYELGRRQRYPNGLKLYMDYLEKNFAGLHLNGIKIAIDCANGAASEIAPELFKRLGANVIISAAQPNGININDHCGSTYMENLCALIRQEQCDIGFAFDGDADRMLAVDALGRPVNGDQIMLIVARYLKQIGKLPKDTLVVTVMSNLGLKLAAKKLGIRLSTTKVGDRYVLQDMIKNGYAFGGEQSGHLILSEYATTGDGLLSALSLLQALSHSGETLAEAAQLMHIYPQVLVPAYVSNKVKHQVMDDPDIVNLIHKIEKKLGTDSRILVRPSGTEPQVRVMIEGDQQELIREQAQMIADAIMSRYSEDHIEF